MIGTVLNHAGGQCTARPSGFPPRRGLNGAMSDEVCVGVSSVFGGKWKCQQKKIKSGKRHDFTLWWKVLEVAYTRQVLE